MSEASIVIPAETVAELSASVKRYDATTGDMEEAHPDLSVSSDFERVPQISTTPSKKTQEEHTFLMTLRHFDQKLLDLLNICQKDDIATGNITIDHIHIVSNYLSDTSDSVFDGEYKTRAGDLSVQVFGDPEVRDIAILSSILTQCLTILEAANAPNKLSSYENPADHDIDSSSSSHASSAPSAFLLPPALYDNTGRLPRK